MVETDGRRLSQVASQGYVRGHKPTPSQESNTLSQVSCYTTISQVESEGQGPVQTSSVDSLNTVTGEVRSLSSSHASTNSVLQQPASPSVPGPTPSFPLPRQHERPRGDFNGEEKKQKGGRSLSQRRNIDISIDIEKCDGSLDNSNVSEDPATPLLLETVKGKSYSAKLPTACDQTADCPAESLDILPEDSDVPDERIKTFLSFLWLWSGFFATTTSLALTHEKVPDTAPLPDALLDNINYQRWGLDLSEVLLVLNTLIGAVVVFSNIHRLVILRRIWLILGILYYYSFFRAVTMFITVLPKPDESYVCAAKMEDITPYGKHIYCGDYIFSGHTMTLTMAYLTIKQYSPRRFTVLHWLSFLVSLTGICGLVIARGHYSIDVILAYFVTTRLWWIYHAMATSQTFKRRSDDNFLSQAWWYWIFHYFERNVPCNLPRRYSLSLPSALTDCLTSTRESCKRGCSSEDGELIESQAQKDDSRRNVV